MQTFPPAPQECQDLVQTFPAHASPTGRCPIRGAGTSWRSRVLVLHAGDVGALLPRGHRDRRRLPPEKIMKGWELAGADRGQTYQHRSPAVEIQEVVGIDLTKTSPGATFAGSAAALSSSSTQSRPAVGRE